MAIKIRYVFAIVFVSVGCILSFSNEVWPYVNWYCVVYGLFMCDPVIFKKPFSFNKFISMMIYISLIFLIHIVRSRLDYECLEKFIRSPSFLITLWLCAIFIIAKRYIEEIERKAISSNINSPPSAEK